MTPRPRRRWPLLVAIVVLLALASLGIYLLWFRPPEATYVQVRRGPIRGLAHASGEVSTARQMQLLSPIAERILTVSVAPGDHVLTGTLLVALSADALAYQVEQARLQVEIARLRLEQARSGVRPEEIAIAQADLDAARARLEALQAGPRSEELAIARQEIVLAEAALAQAQEAARVAVESARLRWETAANAVRNAQDNYSRIYWENKRLRDRGFELPQSMEDAETQAWRQVEDAQAAMEQARLAFEQALRDQEATITSAQARLSQARARLQALLAGPEQAELLAAQAQVARAEANLALLQAGPRPSEIQILEIELRQAELQLERAKADLTKAAVTAPFSGTVVEVLVEEGAAVGVYAPLLRLADMQKLQIRARIDEMDVGLVAPGQAVTITVEAFPTLPMTGTILEIAPAVTVDRGTAYYAATIAVTPHPSVTLRLGMAADLMILAADKRSALLVPRTAVQRIGAGYYVTVLRAGRPERVRVTLGIADPQYYEVLAGVEEGEWVQVP